METEMAGKMDNLNVREVVEMALRTEVLGNSYYSELAEKFKSDKDIYELFSFLANQEKKHMQVFSTLRERISDEEPEQWPEVSEYLRAYVESAFFMGRDKALPHMQNIAAPNAAIGLALGFEKETLLYFYAMRDMLKDTNIVDEIIKEEKSHIVALTHMRQKLSGG
ncbi:MAG: ferritin family protein [Nitrospirae bacterium]|nr:ferritin family protein [Nitrospirota bacterium]